MRGALIYEERLKGLAVLRLGEAMTMKSESLKVAGFQKCQRSTVHESYH